jgi:O-antigen/teichoic acid export membrane protein
MALILPPVLGLMILASPIITHWLGPAFADQARAAQVLLSYQLLTVGMAIGDSIVISRGHARKRLNSVFILTLGNLVLSVILVQTIGIMGVVIGTALPWIIDFPWRLRTNLAEVGVSFAEWLQHSAGPVYLSLLATGAVAFAAHFTPLVDSLAGVAIAMLLAVGSAWLGFVTFSLTPAERDELQGLAHRARTALMRGG